MTVRDPQSHSRWFNLLLLPGIQPPSLCCLACNLFTVLLIYVVSTAVLPDMRSASQSYVMNCKFWYCDMSLFLLYRKSYEVGHINMVPSNSYDIVHDHYSVTCHQTILSSGHTFTFSAMLSA